MKNKIWFVEMEETEEIRLLFFAMGMELKSLSHDTAFVYKLGNHQQLMVFKK